MFAVSDQLRLRQLVNRDAIHQQILLPSIPSASFSSVTAGILQLGCADSRYLAIAGVSTAESASSEAPLAFGAISSAVSECSATNTTAVIDGGTILQLAICIQQWPVLQLLTESSSSFDRASLPLTLSTAPLP